MELRQLKYFIEVAKREHVTEAADALHVAQSAVSRQIFNLEEELGVNLFIREGRNVRLTPIGRVFLDHMEQALNVIDDGVQVVEEYTDPQRGTIHIGFPSSLAAYILPTAISAFRNQYPNVKFELNQGSYYDLKNAVIRGESNIALLGPVPLNEKRLKHSILFTEKIVALLPEQHRLAQEKALHLNQLRDDSFVLFPEGFVLHDIIIKACRQLGFSPKVSFEGKDIDAIKGLVSAGLGVSLVPEITLVDHLPRSTVKIPIKEPDVTRTVGVVIPAERQLLPTEKLFYEFIKQFFSRLESFQY
ncbi:MULTISPECIES: LysR family transcriptional regulator [Virgibacillus]|uniref:LysR family transcriptional regulator n=1 Tax=Virgibacillus halodenitrificans TaxID=1482 RepID=A0AAC9J3E4_VIRHA|nr:MULTISPECIES: LysR family transcriptional regulator [Virgibacillus]AIF44790.1 LysR family transcriptional regulator [Virgibacillus sp. SK37]APC49878.1 LysR family transcriptional regulator [Virgibacillus halodenitrificans]MBD1223513.1 LysR family transcriptional regulator [Virgibacillus halodenitrificans]MCG1029130.1 LysR family transcriptional regulator [Virgibacillus halodenitrificans]MCJ0933090.1 LysR family transcriptional regulator [Virgibacillus halodenitrificans]